MQSRMVSVGSSRSLPSVIRKRVSFFPWMRAASTANRVGPGDPAIHSHDPTDEELEQAARAGTAEKDPLKTRTMEDEQPTLPRPTTPYASSPKIENTAAVNSGHVDPFFQQKRPYSHRSNAPDPAVVLEEGTCAGVDGSPLFGDSEENSKDRLRRREEDDYREYFKDHRPSPISEFEVAETRKPIAQATDGSLNDDGINYDVSGWKEEQMDSAEEALMRGEAIFRQRAEEGVPDWPHSRVLH